MPTRWSLREFAAIIRYAAKWTVLASPVAAIVGCACALFLWSLDWATQMQWDRPELLWALPVAGAAIALAYRLCGKSADRGNNLILEEIHEPGAGVPARLAPLVLASSVATILFGGSAGREGTAIQIGGSLASAAARRLKLSPQDIRILLMAGMSAGFGGVFGTPVTGAIFAAEVLAIGRISYEALAPCLLAAVISDWTCTAWGVHHTDYHQLLTAAPQLDWLLLGKTAAAAIAFGLTSSLFSETTHILHQAFARAIRWPLLRPVAGALLVIALTYASGTRAYLGLGVYSPPGDPDPVSITSSFSPGGADAFSWLWKIIFTAVTLSSGFKGGEVTPLFFIGATLGNVLGTALGAPVDLFAALGFVAVFAGATNTPIACTMMGLELFGAGHAIYIATACFLAYLFSGHTSIYHAQRIATPKVTADGRTPPQERHAVEPD